MDHLEANRLKSVQSRHERMTRGIGSFLEGRSMAPASASMPTPAARKKQQATSAPKYEEELRDPKDATVTNAPGTPVTPKATNGQEPTAGQRPIAEDATRCDPEMVFSRAAKIIKEAADTEGCVFLDGSPPGFGGAPPRMQRRDSLAFVARPTPKPGFNSSSDEEDDDEILSTDDGWPSSRILGHSNLVEDNPSMPSPKPLSQRFLKRLLRRYPKGQVFNFDSNRGLKRTDASEDDLDVWAGSEATKKWAADSVMDTCSTPPPGEFTDPEGMTWDRQKEGRMILQMFPGARSVAFVPIWDPRKEKWSIGAFAYTLTPTRIFTGCDDLNYLRAFGMLAAMEKLRLEAVMADKAKADTLGSLSHELRSPLHGIILGVELLHETSLNNPQGNLAHMIETCCRTLTDTVDHLLDYSKINHFMGKDNKQRRGSGYRILGGSSHEPGAQSLLKESRLDVLVEEVMESVYAGFNFQHLSIAQLSRHQGFTGDYHKDANAMRHLDSVRAMEELGPTLTKKGEVQVRFGEVTVVLMMDPALAWDFYAQPGAIRRIVMNLFGNSLKYTRRGIIKVILEQSSIEPFESNDGHDCRIHLTVIDTGVGMSESYLQNGLYKAFSQENELAPGTGLGLSLVKQIVASLGGHIAINSKVGSGTTVRVSLPLSRLSSPAEPCLELADADESIKTHMHQLKTKRVLVAGFGKHQSLQDHQQPDALVESVCHDVLQMDTTTDVAGETLPDVIICSEDALAAPVDPNCRYGKLPCLVICSNALSAYQYTTGVKTTGRSGPFGFITQPSTPRKLVSALSLVMNRKAKRGADEISTGQAGETSQVMERPRLVRKLSHPSNNNNINNNSKTLCCQPDCPPCPEFLLVDDNGINLKILASYVNKLGRLYHTATNGQEALDAYQQTTGHYKCILMDITMPVMDGFEATRRIRALEQKHRLQPTLILALSGLASESAQQEAIGSGVDLFLTKPVRLKELGAILKAKGILRDV